MASPGFYRELIENSDTIDATTRQHVAFIVFYGSRSGIVQESGASYRPYLARHRLQGLSVSDGGDISSGSMPTAVPEFSSELASQFRYSQQNLNYSALSHQMTRAAARIMELYDIRESTLPCLLFVDGNNPKTNLVIQLDPKDPLQSLYSNALGPMSEEFGQLSAFWKSRDSLGWIRTNHARAKEDLADVPTKLYLLEASIAQSIEVEKENGSLKEYCDRLSQFRQLLAGDLRDSAIVKTFEVLQCGPCSNHQLEDQFSQILGVLKKIEELEIVEGNISTGVQVFRSEGHKAMELAKLNGRLVRERKSVSNRLANLKVRITQQISEIERRMEASRRRVSELNRDKENMEDRLRRSKEYLEINSADTLLTLAAEIAQREEVLREKGYEDSVLSAARPSAYSAIQAMYNRGLLGYKKHSGSGQRRMRILFLTANPTATTQLDLEEEVRNLELELGAVKYRDQIEFRARHAVRPDDLLRYVRLENPTIIHFSGHGSAKGIVLRNDKGGYTEVSGANLRRFLEGRGIELLVLNACYTKVQVEHVLGVVGCIVGTTDVIRDEAARRFTIAFYRTLGNGFSIREAFRDGGDAVALHGLDDVYWSSGGLDRIPLLHAIPET